MGVEREGVYGKAKIYHKKRSPQWPPRRKPRDTGRSRSRQPGKKIQLPSAPRRLSPASQRKPRYPLPAPGKPPPAPGKLCGLPERTSQLRTRRLPEAGAPAGGQPLLIYVTLDSPCKRGSQVYLQTPENLVQLSSKSYSAPESGLPKRTSQLRTGRLPEAGAPAGGLPRFIYVALDSPCKRGSQVYLQTPRNSYRFRRSRVARRREELPQHPPPRDAVLLLTRP